MTNDPRHDQLGRQLRAEALGGSSPQFSESLHGRVMDALASEQSAPMTIAHPARHRPWPLAAAAALLLGASLAAYFAAQRPATVPPPAQLSTGASLTVGDGAMVVSYSSPLSYSSLLSYPSPLGEVGRGLASLMRTIVNVPVLPQPMRVPTPDEIVNRTAGPLLQGLGDLHSRTYAAADTDARNLAKFMARQLDLAAPPAFLQ